MITLNYTRLGRMLKKHRGERSLRDVAPELELSPATLVRIERGELHDLGAFLRICNWMRVHPGTFLESRGPGLQQGPELTLREALLIMLEQEQGLPEALREAFGTLLRNAFKQYPTP